jgi:hypothetical protein
MELAARGLERIYVFSSLQRSVRAPLRTIAFNMSDSFILLVAIGVMMIMGLLACLAGWGFIILKVTLVITDN